MADEPDLRHAIQSIIKGDGLVTRCLVLTEVLRGEDYSFVPMWDGLLPWDVRGWLEHAVDYMETFAGEDDEEE